MRKIRYITGRGGDATGGLSAHLETLTEDYGALAVNHAFLQQSFLDQFSTVRKFCITEHCNIIACSYGAYLLLHSLIDQPPISARVMLLSPVLGQVGFEEAELAPITAHEKALKTAILDGRLGRPKYLEIVTGEKDEICDAALAVETGEKLGVEVNVLRSERHLVTPSKVAISVSTFLYLE